MDDEVPALRARQAAIVDGSMSWLATWEPPAQAQWAERREAERHLFLCDQRFRAWLFQVRSTPLVLSADLTVASGWRCGPGSGR